MSLDSEFLDEDKPALVKLLLGKGADINHWSRYNKKAKELSTQPENFV